MGAGLDGPEPAVEDAADEVSRQRRKHWDASLNRPVPGFPEMTLGQVVAEVETEAGEDRAEGTVSQFLAGRGHTPTTIRTVQGYLDLRRALESRREAPPPDAADEARYVRRASVLEELQARLLRD